MTDFGSLGSPEELARFQQLGRLLGPLAIAQRTDPEWVHTSVVVPSLSVNQEELEKVEGAAFYEERLLFTLIRLKHPGARLVYLTSQPLHPETLEYYLQQIPGIPISHSRRRLLLLCLYDASPKPLTAKILARPRLLQRIRSWVGAPEHAYLTVFNSTRLERRLAVELGLPLNAVDPELLWLGTKSGSRKAFAEADVPCPTGFNDVRTRAEVVSALDDLCTRRPGIRQAVVKLDDSFAGEGNGIFEFPSPLSDDPRERRQALDEGLERLRWASDRETPGQFFAKLERGRGVVEEWVEADVIRSPSAQLRIGPDGELALLSTHDQVLGGSTGQAYLGCRFPADEAYRSLVSVEAMKIGEALVEHGVIGRFGIDFIATRAADGPWRCHAVEINLRMGGTTPPFMALEFLTDGTYDLDTGLYTAADGRPRYYFATESLKSPAYKGLMPEDLFELSVAHGIHFRQTTLTGVMFFMIGALSQYGKIGIVSIGATPQEADQLYQTTVGILDRATGAAPDTAGTPHSLFERRVPPLE